MKYLFAVLILSLSSPLWAQSVSPTLTPYEKQVYGDHLWKIPREPYQSQYDLEKHKAKIDQEVKGLATNKNRKSRNIPTAKSPETKAQERFQNQKRFENDQKAISERSKKTAAQPLLLTPKRP